MLMMEKPEKTEIEAATPASNPKKWKLGLTIVAVLAAFSYLGYQIGFPI